MDRGCPCTICDDTSHTTARCPELYHPERVSGGGGGHSHDDDDEHIRLFQIVRRKAVKVVQTIKAVQL